MTDRPFAASAERWEEPPRSPSGAAPVIAADGFEGPLDWLLELARAERIDLRKLSIRTLIEAFVGALEAALASRARADLSRWGEFLVMAAQLALLRSRLLLPPDSAAAQAAQTEAEALRRQLLEADAMRVAAAWLAARPQLGRDVFGRGGRVDLPAGARVATVADLFQACLVALRVPDHADAYVPRVPAFWRVPEALARITRLMGDGIEGELSVFLPRMDKTGPDQELRCRAAVASTVIAALELSRTGAIALAQPQPWGEVQMTARQEVITSMAAAGGIRPLA